MLAKYEVCRGLFHGFNWSHWATGRPAGDRTSTGSSSTGVVVLNGPFDIVYLPDYGEPYAINVSAGMGTSEFCAHLHPAPLSRSCSRRGSCSGYAVLRGEKAPDDALARELGAMGLL